MGNEIPNTDESDYDAWGQIVYPVWINTDIIYYSPQIVRVSSFLDGMSVSIWVQK
jgi:hypothetical protein